MMREFFRRFDEFTETAERVFEVVATILIWLAATSFLISMSVFSIRKEWKECGACIVAFILLKTMYDYGRRLRKLERR